jgi:uncharacterized membrane protein YbjE (DUF340 family)
MFIVLAFMFVGILTGYLFRNRKMQFQNRLILTLIWVLLFLLGLEVGMNDNVVRKFASLGLEAAVIAVAATLGSVVAAKLLWGRTPKSPKGDF